MQDGTEQNQDSSGGSPDTSGEPQGTSQQQTETISKTEHEKEKAKAVSDALAKAGRTAQSFEAREQAIREQEERMNQWQKERDEAEITAAKGDQSAISEIRRKQQIREQQQDIARQKRELEDREAQIAEKEKLSAETSTAVNVWIAAQEYKVDPDTLKEKVDRYKLTDKEAIADLAKTMAGSAQQQPGGDTQNPLHVDSASGSGGSEPTTEQLDKMPMDDFANWWQKKFSPDGQ